MRKLRWLRVWRSACRNEDSGTELLILSTVNSVSAGVVISRDISAQDLNILRCKTKTRKLFIIELSEPRAYALLPRVVLSLNKSTHQA
jgi:hypothetical protein